MKKIDPQKYLVGGWPTPLKNISQMGVYIIPNWMEKNMFQTTNQGFIVLIFCSGVWDRTSSTIGPRPALGVDKAKSVRDTWESMGIHAGPMGYKWIESGNMAGI